ncbi:putative membrane protein [[Clostridium] cellulosi]|uniref:Putative membrane protein n=1 Tax=[Clostridium] cellulosi TaxID=29343 RepID=A0A078KVG0_9FIRM|nr:putative membrane protein [[Clostridium] cellulosi]
MCRHRPIFPGGRPPSIFGTDELNFRVRNGNGWVLIVIGTGYILILLIVVFGDP